jgi:hypothetical protein
MKGESGDKRQDDVRWSRKTQKWTDRKTEENNNRQSKKITLLVQVRQTASSLEKLASVYKSTRRNVPED